MKIKLSWPISRVLSWTIIHLGATSPLHSSNLPESDARHAKRIPIWSCSRWGLPCHQVLPLMRCALTAPFHPYRLAGGLLSAALSVGSRPPGVTWHLASRSPDFPLLYITAAIAWPTRLQCPSLGKIRQLVI